MAGTAHGVTAEASTGTAAPARAKSGAIISQDFHVEGRMESSGAWGVDLQARAVAQLAQIFAQTYPHVGYPTHTGQTAIRR